MMKARRVRRVASCPTHPGPGRQRACAAEELAAQLEVGQWFGGLVCDHAPPTS
jgi:hypothetical protein